VLLFGFVLTELSLMEHRYQAVLPLGLFTDQGA
jgi:hypothetical protein